MDSWYTSPILFMALFDKLKCLAVGSARCDRRFFPRDLAQAEPDQDTFEWRQSIFLPHLIALMHASATRTKPYLTTATPVINGEVPEEYVRTGKVKPGLPRDQRTIVVVPDPVALYNNTMTGVDLANNNACRVTLWRQSKRYIISIFLHFLNVAIANAWYIYQRYNSSNPDITLKNFRMQLAHELVPVGFTKRQRYGPVAVLSAERKHTQVANKSASVRLRDGENRKETVRGRCVVCCGRKSVKAADGVKRQKQIGNKATLICKECSAATGRKVFVCSAMQNSACWPAHCKGDTHAIKKAKARVYEKRRQMKNKSKKDIEEAEDSDEPDESEEKSDSEKD